MWGCFGGNQESRGSDLGRQMCFFLAGHWPWLSVVLVVKGFKTGRRGGP